MSEEKKTDEQIWQAYDGEFGPEPQRRARERIHWICGQAVGQNVLDIGCSQGVCDILLAREGMSVTGIDDDADALEHARRRLEEEAPETQKRVRFLRGDFMDFSADGEKYDTVILTGVLERLLHPEKVLEKAAGVLVDGGRIIVLVPFGVDDRPEHKRTYYLSELLNEISPFAVVHEIQFFTQGLGCVALKSSEEPGVAVNMQLLVREEEAFYGLERPLRDRLRDEASRQSQMSRQLAQFKREKALLGEELAGLQSKQARLTEQLREQAKQIQDQQNTIEAQKENTESLNQRYYLQRRDVERKYETLCNSRLGRIQLGVWRRRAARKQRGSLLSRLKAFAKRFPFLVALVHFLRGKKKSDTTSKSVAPPKSEAPRLAADMGYYDRIRNIVEQIPKSNGSRYYQKLKPRIGWITDQILYDAFKSAADGVLLRPDNWTQMLEQIDWLFFITAWRGMDEEWRGLTWPNSEARKTIYQIIDACKQRNIPTVYYSVEDPPNYDYFIEIAQHFDYVFTAAVEMLPRYREDCGHDRVYQLCYGIDPILHNPVGFRKFPKQPEVFFAGSWMSKYPERGKDLQVLFDGVLQAGRSLRIVDRNLFLSEEMYRYPAQYAAYLAPPLEHEALQRVHKLYDWAINVNSVKESATMFANRTYELQAMGNLMLSNYSVGVNSLLPAIFTCQNLDEIPAIINSLSPEEVYEHQITGVRFAMRGNTCYERVAEILNTIGIETKLPEYQVAVVVPSGDQALKEAFDHQTYPHRSMVTAEELAARYGEYDLVAFFKFGAEYGDFYLEDMINGFKYTDSDYITKAGYYSGEQYMAGPEHDYVSVMPDKYRTVFWARSFQAGDLLDWKGSVDLPNGYSIDHFMFNDKMIDRSAPDTKYELSVIVPVYNNGPHLYGKAFNSLRRSSIFHQMEIILVDDGSTDSYTPSVIRSLARRYPNVRTYFFEAGGSGSASRPRNQGIQMASADYIAFMDPDDEAINDAYAKMLAMAKTEQYDLVVANMSRFRLKEELANYHAYFQEYCGSDVVTGDKKEFLKKIRFTPMNIQVMVIRKEIIIQSGLSQVVGAVGEDSFFSWQLFTSADRIKSVPLVAYIYYALVQNSTSNTVTKKFFESSLLLERVQREWLEENGLLEAYMNIRFNGFFRDWYLKKLSQAKLGQEDECAQVLYDIFLLYQTHYDYGDQQINAFIEQIQNNGVHIDT